MLLEVAAIASTALVLRGDAERFLTAPFSCSLALRLAAGLSLGFAVGLDSDFAADLDLALDFAAGLAAAFAAASGSGLASTGLLSLADLPCTSDTEV